MAAALTTRATRADAGEVAVVGGGPVGLYLALVLTHLGVAVRLFERRAEAVPTSRSIGVHPPSLELLGELGLAERFLAQGVLVRKAEAYGERGRLGRLTFDACASPHRYVLTVPQATTESILRGALSDRAPGAVETRNVTHVEQTALSSVALHLAAPGADGAGPGERRAFAAVVGCDGKRSVVRQSLAIPFVGGAYEGEYAMADFPDLTSLGSVAAIYLRREGLLESFPLPGGLRRWVARCAAGTSPTVETLVAHIRERAGVQLRESLAVHPSSFRAERFHARRLAHGRVALAGDAAHVVSPIGGQGMNLGWLGARTLARTIAANMRNESSFARALLRDGRRRQRIARAAARRAELNMWLGRPQASPWMRETLVSLLLGLPVQSLLARVFTMRGLSLGW